MRPGDIAAVLFDMGGTLEDVYYDDALRLQAMPGLREILSRHGLDPDLSTAELYAIVDAGMKAYGEWRLATERELLPEVVWTEYIFPHCGLTTERLAGIAEELAFYYDTHFYTRRMRPEVPAALRALRDKGFRLGVISNVYSRGQVPYNLAHYGIDHYFQAVVMSSCFGRRKPNPAIFLEGARRLGVAPEACAYIGDTVSRDVAGARRAGYALVIQIKSFLTSRSDTENDVEAPDTIVTDLRQVIPLIERGPRDAPR